MSTSVLTYLPNKVVANPQSPGDTDWHFVGINPTSRDLTFYSTLAAVKAAGDLTYPGLDGGGKIGNCLIATKDSAGATGSDVLYRVNCAVLPTGLDEATNVVAGSGQQISEACPFRNIAICLTDATDVLILDGSY